MKKQNKGQIALIVLLVLVVMLTVGLALISRTVTEIKISEHEKEAVRAFSAAEAGIEEALKDISVFTPGIAQDVDVGDLTARVTVDEIINNIETQIKKNSSAKVDLTGADAGLNNLTIYWAKRNDPEETPGGACSEASTPASLEIIIYDKEGAVYSTQRYAYNACVGLNNGFDGTTPSDGGSGFLKRVDVAIDPSKDRLLSIKALYNKTTVRLVGNVDLPVQQYQITSRAVAEGGETKAVKVSKTVSALPEIFDYVLFSGDQLVK